MTNYKAILGYYHKGNTTTQIAKLCECSRTTVAEYQYPKIGDNQVKQISDNSFLFYGNRGTYSRNTE